MNDFHKMLQKISYYYELLADQQSKDIFRERLACDVCLTGENVVRLFSAGALLSREETLKYLGYQQELQELAETGKKVLIYGTGFAATHLGRALIEENIPFYGFCSRSQKLKNEGLLSKPVLDHEQLSENTGDYYFLIPTSTHYEKALQRLKARGIADERVLPYFRGSDARINVQYFEFLEYFRKGTAFVDAGCYDGADSIKFSKWCGVQYSKIFAFEPDPSNAAVCADAFEKDKISNVDLIQAGLGEQNGSVSLCAGKAGSSSVVEGDCGTSDAEMCVIDVVTLDSVVKNTTVGFIKMDIEGSEYGALVGAKNTIARDKPFMAISVYHKPGDQLVTMEYLHSLVPEYRFWLRHYTSTDAETVLYAAVP